MRDLTVFFSEFNTARFARLPQGLQTELCTLMLEEPLVDVSAKFGALLSPQWLSDEEPLRSIAETLKDYFTDYQHLHPK